MPVTYAIDVKEKVIRTTCVGNVTFDEVLAHFRELEHDPNCADRLDVFLDVSGTTSLPAGSQIAAVAQEVKRIQARVRFNLCAIVATRDALFGMLRIFEVMAEPYFTAVHVFRVAAEAEAWLASQKLPTK